MRCDVSPEMSVVLPNVWLVLRIRWIELVSAKQAQKLLTPHSLLAFLTQGAGTLMKVLCHILLVYHYIV